MPKKPYSRTFRYSEETRNILDQYDGNFDELCHYAFFTAREAEKEVERLENRKNDLLCQINMLSCMKTMFSKLDFEYNQFYGKFQDIIKNIENV